MHDLFVITKKFTIRKFRAADARPMWQNIQDQELFANTLQIPFPYRLKHAREHITKKLGEYKLARPSGLGYAIEMHGEIVGAIGVTFRGPVAEVGYWLTKAHRGQGIMTEVVGLFSDWLLKSYHVERLLARVFVQNPASGRVLEKVGFRLTKKITAGENKNGQPVDILEYTKK